MSLLLLQYGKGEEALRDEAAGWVAGCAADEADEETGRGHDDQRGRLVGQLQRLTPSPARGVEEWGALRLEEVSDAVPPA